MLLLTIIDNDHHFASKGALTQRYLNLKIEWIQQILYPIDHLKEWPRLTTEGEDVDLTLATHIYSHSGQRKVLVPEASCEYRPHKQANDLLGNSPAPSKSQRNPPLNLCLQ